MERFGITGRIIYPTAPETSGSFSGVAVVIPAKEAIKRNDAGEYLETHEEFMARIAAKDVPYGVPYQIIPMGDLPADRYFRNAWEYAE